MTHRNYWHQLAPSIRNVRIRKVPAGRRLNFTAMIHGENNGPKLMLGTRGAVYSHYYVTNWGTRIYTESHLADAKAIYQLLNLPMDEYAALEKSVLEGIAASQVSHSAERLENLAEEIGIKLTKAQREKLLKCKDLA